MAAGSSVRLVFQVRDGDGLGQQCSGGCGDTWLDSGDNIFKVESSHLLDEMCGERDGEELGMIPSFCPKQLSSITY